MKNSSINRGIPSGNPIANALVVVIGVIAIAVSLVLGFLAFIVVGSIVAVLASIIGIRIWWFNRKLAANASTGETNKPAASGVIEGEYRVVADDREGE